MHLKSVSFKGFKRFTDVSFIEIPVTARLVVLAGPNGSGKSSFFDGLKTWHWAHGGAGSQWNEIYGTKSGSVALNWTDRVSVEFHEDLPKGSEELKKLIYVRSAFRNEPDFSVGNVQKQSSPLDTPRVNRLIDNDASVQENYQRLLFETFSGVFDQSLADSTTIGELRERLIGKIRDALLRVFPDLRLDGIGDPVGTTGAEGSFYFSKNGQPNFHFKNLSGGEKAAFDLIVDSVVKDKYYDNSIWCVDEPESHLNTRVQSELLQTLLDLLPTECQMILASHSIGFMSKAWEIAKTSPEAVAFIDFQNDGLDTSVTITPVKPSREFWMKTLDVALGDLAKLVAPGEVVLCEGRPIGAKNAGNAEFDASCYRKIFAEEFPNTDFMSVGNSLDVSDDRLEAGRAIATISSGTRVIRVRDRDLMTTVEVNAAEGEGIRALSRRHIESYLLDDEVITALCESVGRPSETSQCLTIKNQAIADSVSRGNDADDLKNAIGDISVGLRRLLSLSNSGSTSSAFARDVLAPLVTPGMEVYEDLRLSIFGI